MWTRGIGPLVLQHPPRELSQDQQLRASPSVLDLAYYVGLILVIIGFCSELVRPVLRPSDGSSSHRRPGDLHLRHRAWGLSRSPRIPESWIHAGFIQYIFVHGHPLEDYDGRFSWPGAFSMGAVLTKSSGKPTRWASRSGFHSSSNWPSWAPLIVITRSSGVRSRVAVVGHRDLLQLQLDLSGLLLSPGSQLFLLSRHCRGGVRVWKPLKLAIADNRFKSIRTRIRRRVGDLHASVSRDETRPRRGAAVRWSAYSDSSGCSSSLRP